eukprot:gene10683-14346_t
MLNPWSSTPNDVALAPFKRYLDRIESQRDIQNILVEQQAKNYGAIAIRDESNESNGLIDKLRTIDRITMISHQDMLNNNLNSLNFETDSVLSNGAIDELNNLTETLAKNMIKFNKDDVLVHLYEQVLNISRNIKDDMQSENKIKLVANIKSAEKKIKLINMIKKDYIHDNKESDFDTDAEQILQELVGDDYPLSYLFDIINDCRSRLQTIRPNSSGLTNIPIEDSTTSANKAIEEY